MHNLNEGQSRIWSGMDSSAENQDGVKKDNPEHLTTISHTRTGKKNDSILEVSGVIKGAKLNCPPHLNKTTLN